MAIIRRNLDGEHDDKRRERLHELDSLLDALEQLNLRESHDLTPQLRERLEGAGISVPAKPNVTELIERVWDVQERYLQSGGQEVPGR